MGVTIGHHIYSLSAHSTIIPDLAVLYSLVVAFVPRRLFYLLDIGHFGRVLIYGVGDVDKIPTGFHWLSYEAGMESSASLAALPNIAVNYKERDSRFSTC